MTVISGKQNYNYPKPNSGASSDTESLHLGSDTESVHGESGAGHSRVYRPPPVRVSHVEELVNIKKSSGKKKLRRYQNRCVLHTLNEEDENENVFVIMEDYKGPFARLLEDPDALEYWNTFIEKSEEEQTEIVKAFSEKFCKDNLENVEKSYKHGRLSARIRRTIKIKKNLSLETIKGFEDELIEFFKATPQDIYIRFPPTSFDRLLLHAIAQYHMLKSLSVLVEDVGKRSVEVYNTNSDWTPADCFLTDFVKELRR
ncbi:hypothetical protein NQ315_010305 [Exocentrus adspersus]|uniref:R3H-associated N-terminal domain-containing protein n=1 Tax=Exocentrus adspersus TaxID=1586481 RepID=A0AAV8WAX7_9CUCU|nr:hypothetical protein NQ315_010305 [Exocentrus adspersus]